MQGVEARENRNGFKVFRLHYTADPVKATPEWFNTTRPGMPEDKWEQEYEINFNVLHGKRFYGEFNYEDHTRSLKYNPNLALLRGWDFGYHYPAVIFAQIDLNDRLLILREEQGQDEALINFAKRIVKITGKEFPGCKIKDFADPAGKQSTDKSERTSVDILKTFGIRPHMKKTMKDLGFNIIRNLLIKKHQLPDGKETPRLLVDRRCGILIDGFMGGYHYKETREGKLDSDDPDGGGYYEHAQDALRYITIALFKVDGSVYRNIRPFFRKRESVNSVTGY